MAITVRGAVLEGVDARAVEVEVDLLRRLPAMVIVGLAQGAVRESSERVRSAVESSGLSFPRKRIVVNLAPAALRKQGTSLDLATALGILAADEQVPLEAVQRVICAGELALGGQLRPVRGALSMAQLARQEQATLLVAHEAALQASMVPGVEVVGVRSLAEAVAWLRGEVDAPQLPASDRAPTPPSLVDMADVRGQVLARDALEVSAAGAHHMLMIGPPGCGKSMLARRLPTILPPMSFDEALEATAVHAAANLVDGCEGLLHERPFRAPHHTVTAAGLVGDRSLRPGELSLAHQGVLFLDEAPEFRRSVIEVLRQPLEEGEIRLRRAAGYVRLPSAVTLVMAANPCPCGLASTDCGCPVTETHRYLRRLSGPLLDRVDLHLRLEPITPSTLLFGEPGEPSAVVRMRVGQARRRQLDRGQRAPNGHLSDQEITRVAQLTDEARRTIAHAADHHRLSARATTRLLRVARTVADLKASDPILTTHVETALQWRALVAA